MDTEEKPPLPPFDAQSAERKVRLAENAWNSRNPRDVAEAYTIDSKWRNRHLFLTGREAIITFLTDKWRREFDYRLVKELWTFEDNRIAVRFAYEWHDAKGQWFRSYGNENWSFARSGLMQTRHASINDLAISPEERLLIWPAGPRPTNHPGLSALGL